MAGVMSHGHEAMVKSNTQSQDGSIQLQDKETHNTGGNIALSVVEGENQELYFPESLSSPGLNPELTKRWLIPFHDSPVRSVPPCLVCKPSQLR